MNELTNVIETGITTSNVGLQFKNKKLEQQTKAIEKLMTATKRNMFEIAVRLSVIKGEALYEADGYKDVFDYASIVLGYKKNMCYKMIAVAEKFIEQNTDSKGYHSIIAKEDEDYTVSQLIELQGLESETVVELNGNEVITPDMTTKEIRETVKEFKNGVIDVNGNRLETEDEETEDEASETETEKEEVDASALAVLNILESLDTLIADERLESNTENFKTIKMFFENLEM